MQAFQDHYRTLQVHHEASQEVIEAAYKRLCRIYHPDLNHSPRSEDRMKDINAAYEVLCDAVLRRGYHREWLTAANRGFAAGPRPQAGVNAQQFAADQAMQALDAYFRCLMGGLWDSAYVMLTSADRKAVPGSDFREWKQTVANSWKMGSYAIKPFRRYSNCTVSGAAYHEVYEFSVFVCDMDAATGRISEENYLKYVALDGGLWRVCLGYTDVKPLILRFKYMAENAALLDPDKIWAEAVMSRDGQTGLFSREGFLQQAEDEAVRSRRYGNVFTVALFLIRPKVEATVFTDQDYARMCVVHAAMAIGAIIRRTDIFARWGATELALIFTETPRENAVFAVEKIMNKLKTCQELDYDAVCGLAQFDGAQLEDTMAEAASDAQVRKYTSDGVTQTYITINESA